MADRDKIEGKLDQAKGKAKEAWGDATDDKSKQGEGMLDQAKGKVKEKVGDAKDRVDDK